jgi:hypothetical protein
MVSIFRYAEYRRFLFDHLLDVVIRHWDLTMRELGAQSLRLICAHDLDGLAHVAINKLVGTNLLAVYYTIQEKC